MSTAERSFERAALHSAYAGDGASLRVGFQGMPDATADRLGRRVSDRLLRHASSTGDFWFWAQAAHDLNPTYYRAAAAEFQRAAKGWPAPSLEPPPRQLARYARKRAAHARSSTALYRELVEANRSLLNYQVDDVTIGEIVRWAWNQRGVRDVAA